MRPRLWKHHVRRHNEDDLDDPWGTWDWAAAMIGCDDASDMGGPPNDRTAATSQPGGDAP